MKIKQVVAFCAVFCTFNALAEQIEKPLSEDISISIYNNDLALVRDMRHVELKKGINEVAFEGVASQLKPESVLIMGDSVNVLEQNYDYALLTPYNITEKFVGKDVKTVRINPATGEQVFDKAKLISYQGGEPVLQFNYGIETNFDGHIVFDKLPADLNQKPTLAAKISSMQAALKNIMLAYLTKGISWKTDYVAGVKDEKTLDLTGWVSITNNSGVSYDNAKVQLIAGDVHETPEYPRGHRNGMVMKAMAYSADAVMAEGANTVPESFSAYELYTLDNRTSIQNNQTKQMALIEKNNVLYEKEGRLNSGLSLSGDYASDFEKVHPSVYYILKNDEESNLGVPLPKGIMRFYENDSHGNLQFIGENSIGQTAKGEKLELELGKIFDVFVNGKIEKVRKVSENIVTTYTGKCPRYQVVKAYDAVVEFKNGGNKETVIVFKQYMNPKTTIINESLKGSVSDKSGRFYEWRVELKGDDTQKLTFTAEVTSEETRCN